PGTVAPSAGGGREVRRVGSQVKPPTGPWSLTVRRPSIRATVHQVNGRSSRGCGSSRPLPHLLHHFLFHFLRPGFSLVRAHHPRVTLRVRYCPATIAQNMSVTLEVGRQLFW